MTIHYQDDRLTLLHGDAIGQAATLDTGSVQTVVTSPPYLGLRDYGEDGQYGAEGTVGEYVDRLVALFREVRRVLADDGTVWLNLGDSYAGSGAPGGVSKTLVGTPNSVSSAGKLLPKPGIPKNLLGVPWRVAFGLQDDGWILRSDIIWHKPNPMPESVTDRPTKAHEYLFLLAKQPRYYYDADAIKESATSESAARMAQPRDSRPQLRRALELATQHGLTDAHFEAMRSVGMGDAGKAQVVQSGTGRNAAEVQRLADEAKVALGGYYREFLSGGTVNKRTVWTVPTVPFSAAHFATYPPALIRPCILAGSRPGDTVLDPFSGSGTTGMVALEQGRKYVGIDLNSAYLELSLRERFQEQPLDIFGGAA